MRDKALQLRRILEDRNAQQQCDTQIRESQRYIDYFSEELQRLKSKEHRLSVPKQGSSKPTDGAEPVGLEDGQSRTSSMNTPSLSAASQISQLLTTNPRTPDDAQPRANSLYAPHSFSDLPIEKKKYINLDLLKADTPINRAKVSLKLHDLEYKVDVERKVQAGIKNLSQTLEHTNSTAAADKKRKIELQEKKCESKEKMALLNAAVRKYKNLYIGEEDMEEEMDGQADLIAARPLRGQPGVHRPVTGKLRLKITEARELAHAPTRMFRAPQTVVMVKVDGNVHCRTRPSKNDKWGELFQMHVDKATEVELLIYDQSGDRTLPIGLLWLKISDITECLRKQKLTLEHIDANWVPADVAQQGTASTNSASSHMASSQASVYEHDDKGVTTTYNVSDEGITAWFDVEPVGRILLTMNFVRENVNKRAMDKLGRAGAVRERKGEVFEMNGHQFVARRFYHIMRCALCSDFMTNLVFQCEDCGLACHKKCYTRVVTRCISRPSTKSDGEELKHRIPHRFEPLTIIGAHWCCHCGYMLPLGFRGAQRCHECGVTCHKKCARFVPDFCGMSMEKANLMLSEMKAASRRRTFHPDSFAQLSLHGQSSNMDAGSGIQESSDISGPSPQSSISTPTSPRLNSKYTRPLSLAHDLPSFQSLSGLFSGASSEVPALRSSFPTSNISSILKTSPVQVNRKVGLDDFNFLAVLGKGNFGKVMLAEEKYTNELYAIKILKKRFVLDNDEVASTRSEKRVFLAASRERHPFLINLHSTFQTETRIYFVMEYVSGGDLMMHIQREQFSEKRARFYACEVLLALEYFHKQGIIYRDLKLDNIMLCLDGHIKLADYGLCKENMGFNNTTNTFCGTPEFMAPEILLEQRYGRAVDWWAFGVLLYEMLLGQSPFKGEDEEEIFDAVLEDEILYPINMSRNSVSVCQKLLERDPSKRLGAGKADAAEVKAHPFFSGINWEEMLTKQVTPPFLPTVNGRADTSNFDEEFTREIPILTPVNAMLLPEEQQEFAGFSYVANWAIAG
ncbi:kinase-like domain-containing protein [Radiomyces spectabilis]|uniref:kinase-like domain-containing protein n=1 Tax=Radiomyces spectabilis TaxID=64574 RepID=UPI002220D029|nr:kinase-like domain-containing protein [Radiomyces spectabilis]KAI8370731.1 kinase-like domain-containing protein [Radiomyces spectabilis]